MSKCDVTIEFERRNRKYRVGDEVTGTVRVQVSEDVICRRFTVERYWQTHGKGTKDKGGQRTVLVSENLSWRAGEHHEFPFRFQAPTRPFTYRGQYVNVSHYVAARADVPWALDPKVEREYLLYPGAPEPIKQGGQKPVVFRMARGEEAAVVPLALAVVAIILFTIPLLPLALVVWIALPSFLIWRYRSAIAEHRLGKVSVQLGSSRVAPGEHVAVRIGFRPLRLVQINRITAKLEGIEECDTGSGSDRETHKTQLHEEEFLLYPGATVVGGKSFEVRQTVSMPRTQAYTFSSDHNRIKWTLAVRIDIPHWPDWRESTVLTLRPGAATERSAALGTADSRFESEAGSRRGRATPPPVTPFGERAPPSSPVLGPAGLRGLAPAREAAPPPTVPEPPTPVAEALARIAGTDRFGGERQRLIDELGEQAFRFATVVERVEWTVSFDVDEAFRGGRTVVAKVARSDAAIALLFGKTENGTIDALNPGRTIEVTGRFVGWNAFHGRAEIAVSDFVLGE